MDEFVIFKSVILLFEFEFELLFFFILIFPEFCPNILILFFDILLLE